MTSLPPLCAFSSLLLPLLPTLFPPVPFSFLSFYSFPLPHSPSCYSRTIEQMAGCLFYTSLWKISSAVESATFAKNRHRPIQLNAREKGEAVGAPALPTSCTETLSVCTPHYAFGKQACRRAQRGASPLQTKHHGKKRARPASTVSFTAAKADGDVAKVGQCGRGRLLPAL